MSQIFCNRSRNACRGRHRGNRWTNASRCCCAAGVSPCGSRRNSPRRDRNSCRAAWDRFAWSARVIVLPLAVAGRVDLLGDGAPLDHRPGLGQPVPAGAGARLGPGGPVGPHVLTRRWRQVFQAFPGRRGVPPGGHGQPGGRCRVGQVGPERGVALVPLLQAPGVAAQLEQHPLRVDRLGLGVCPLVADDEGDPRGGVAQTAAHFLRVAAAQPPPQLRREAVGGTRVLALAGWQELLPGLALRATRPGRTVAPQAGLAPAVAIPNDLDGVLERQGRFLCGGAAVATATGGQGPGNRKAVALALALGSGAAEVRRPIDRKGDTSQDGLRGGRRKGTNRRQATTDPAVTRRQPRPPENPKSPVFAPKRL